MFGNLVIGLLLAARAPDALVVNVGLVRVAPMRPGTQSAWDPAEEKARPPSPLCELLGFASTAAAHPPAALAGELLEGLCQRLSGSAAGAATHTDPDLFVRVVASPEVSYRSATVVNALSHVFDFRVSVPTEAIPNAGLELYVENDNADGPRDVIGSIHLRRQQLLDALAGDGLLRLDDKEGGLERIEVAVSAPEKERQTTGSVSLDLAVAGRVAPVPGIEVSAGDVIEVEATGQYELEGQLLTPAGARTDGPNIQMAPFADAPHGAAIAVVGAHGRLQGFVTGQCGRFVAPYAGSLLVGIDDQPGRGGAARPAKKAKRSHQRKRTSPGEGRAGEATFSVQVMAATPEEWRSGVASSCLPAAPVALNPSIETSLPPDPSAASPAPAPVSPEWTATATASVQHLLQNYGSTVARAVQRALHPRGANPALQGFDSVPSATGLMFRLSVAWQDGAGTWFMTKVGWDIAPHGQVGVVVLSDTAEPEVGSQNFSDLNRYFATQLYPRVSKIISTTY